MELTQTQIDTYRRCIMREINLRERVYPKRVEQGKMTQQQADFELSTMKEIKNYFDYLQIHATPEQQKLL
ncbi:MAG: hypothetical protein IKR34_02165 [Candidatus Gastranaerophilales bacterium]|nr:hypothetical protein [Elusimicrobiota bacterium]MBR6298028.1 hypothetical protein [Candidatus Gastranaerophilales bacterium]